ncbi:hypothetical protein PSHT_07564 [Puccinia striiformis]|uniref:Uncharacterized protein n=2 Tax=Puccinia striiformis TaxID=27350 RepID=A0A2S4VVP1_9BASI|nr:hypothetical protein KEM48_000496 [Puccinia striiformis f. sp. tritici PST-130]POW13527.1 hypothetical protein PSTT_03730 [Puccinia striiformis]POW13904.1 hypothetical protein PSHT_07564 [Puccinia striiformis]
MNINFLVVLGLFIGVLESRPGNTVTLKVPQTDKKSTGDDKKSSGEDKKSSGDDKEKKPTTNDGGKKSTYKPPEKSTSTHQFESSMLNTSHVDSCMWDSNMAGCKARGY